MRQDSGLPLAYADYATTGDIVPLDAGVSSEEDVGDDVVLDPMAEIHDKNVDALAGFPYCQDCKTYIESVHPASPNESAFSPRSGIDYRGWLGKKKNAFQGRLNRWFILTKGHLIYYTGPEEVGNTFPSGVVHLKGAAVLNKNPKSFDFTVVKDSKKLHLRAPDRASKNEWVMRIRDAFSGKRKLKATYSAAQLARSTTLKGYFCETCRDYLTLDAFTLADYDGTLHVDGSSKWAALAGRHIAIYSALDQVQQYLPELVLHLDQDGIHAASDSITITSPEGPVVLSMSHRDVATWVEAMQEAMQALG